MKSDRVAVRSAGRTLAANAPHVASSLRAETSNDNEHMPDATIARLPLYLRVLYSLAEAGQATISSSELATDAGVNSAKVRKDLSYLGSYGTRGVGYEVATLIERISHTLGLANNWGVALVGVGHLGQALANYAGFSSRGFRIAALIDADPQRVGTTVAGVVVRHIDELPEIIASADVAIGMIATPAGAAQDVCDQLIAAGVTSILNFAPCVLSVPPGVDVRKVDLAIELQILSFHENRKTGALAGEHGQLSAPSGDLDSEERPAVDAAETVQSFAGRGVANSSAVEVA